MKYLTSKTINILKVYTVILLGMLSSGTIASDSVAPSPDLENLGNTVVDAFNTRDAEKLCAAIDFRHLSMRSANKAFDAKIQQEDFAKGLLKQSSVMCHQIMQNINRTNGKAKLLRIKNQDTTKKVLVRLDLGDHGFDYIEFLVKSEKGHKHKIIDWYQLTSGQLVSSTMGRISKLMSSPNPGLLKKTFGIQEIDQNLASQFSSIANSIQQGNYDHAFSIYNELPVEIKNSRTMIMLAFTIANYSNDEEKYKQILKKLEKHYSSDPSAAFMLIDHYFYQKQWDKVLSAINAIELRFGQDAMLEMLKANIYLQSNQFSKSEYHAQNAIDIEPDFIGPYFTLSTSYIYSKKYQEAINAFNLLISEFGYHFNKEDFHSDPIYSDFLKSDAFKNWPI